MSFLGPGLRAVGGSLVRPHDLRLTLEPRHGASEAMVARVVHLGFEVRVELVLADGEEVCASRSRAARPTSSSWRPGDLVWVAPDRPQARALALD